MRRMILVGALASGGLIFLLLSALSSLADSGPRAPMTGPSRSLTLQRTEQTPQATPQTVAFAQRVEPTPPSESVASTDSEPLPAASSQPTAPPPELPALDQAARDVKTRRGQLARFGGTPGSESAVELGLAWLAQHQGPDGYWHRSRYQLECPRNDRCPGVAVQRTDSQLHVGLTGLCTLAFLGAGYTDEVGPYQDTVRQALAALVRAQLDNGGFGRAEDMAGYNDSLATFALAEAYALNRAAWLRGPLELAVGRLVRGQQQLGGWDYLPRPSSGRNDTSITAWVIQALQAADAAGIDVPKESLVRATLHLARATQSDGQVWYSDARRGFDLSDKMQPIYRFGPAMTAAGLLSRMLLGMRSDSPLAEQQTALLLADPPSEHRLTTDESGLHSHYYWYYATVALFHRGGDDWQRWNARMRDTLLPLQDRGIGKKRRHTYGSWAPFASRWGKWGRMGGRVYTTALCVLTLETYYRHVPAYLEEAQPLRPQDWLATLPKLTRRERLWAVEVLREARLEQGEPVLVHLLDHEDKRIALEAAIALSNLDSPQGASVLHAQADRVGLSMRRIVQRAQQRIAALQARPPARGVLRVFDADRKLATIELADCYVGQQLVVEREGARIARLEVAQRFSQQPIRVARVIAIEGDTPQAGDAVQALPAEPARP